MMFIQKLLGIDKLIKELKISNFLSEELLNVNKYAISNEGKVHSSKRDYYSGQKFDDDLNKLKRN